MNQEDKTSLRKSDHIDLTFASQVAHNDSRFYYEPMLAAHPDSSKKDISFLGHTLHAPIWISSMTGGSAEGGRINKNLARACKEFGLGMGLGSCRILLDDPKHYDDFNLRPLLGNQPLFANLGIAQIEKAVQSQGLSEISMMLDRLDADGLIVHINPLQEWMQPEGDVISQAPIDTIKRLIDFMEVPLIIKEVGQGMGPASLKALSQLPIEAIEFAAHGGTNFSKLEMQRDDDPVSQHKDVSSIGHNNEEMISYWNEIVKDIPNTIEIILSGGIKNYLDGYYYMNKLNAPAIYGQASTLLKYAKENYEALHQFIATQIDGLKLAEQYLRVK